MNKNFTTFHFDINKHRDQQGFWVKIYLVMYVAFKQMS